MTNPEGDPPPIKGRRGRSILIRIAVILLLGMVAFLIAVPRLLRSSGVHPEMTARAWLSTLSTAEQDFRVNDRDGNGKHEFWTGDVTGLYAVTGARGGPIKSIAVSLAVADDAPIGKGDPGAKWLAFPPELVQEDRDSSTGYAIRAMDTYPTDKGLRSYREYGVFHPDRFGFCAWPLKYEGLTRKTFIVNESNVVYWKDTGGKPVLTWPTPEEIAKEWTVKWRR